MKSILLFLVLVIAVDGLQAQQKAKVTSGPTSGGSLLYGMFE